MTEKRYKIFEKVVIGLALAMGFLSVTTVALLVYALADLVF